MITRKFVCKEHPEAGFNGWRPSWMPHFDPMEGLGVAHDTLEHGRNDPGTVEAEFIAFGAILWGRANGGWFKHHHPADNLSREFLEQAGYLDREGAPLKQPPATRPLSDEADEEMIQQTAKWGRRYVLAEGDEECREDLAELIPVEHAVGWLRIGFRRAARRYRASNPCEFSYLFGLISEQADAKLRIAELDDVLRVRVDIERGRVHVDLLDRPDLY